VALGEATWLLYTKISGQRICASPMKSSDRLWLSRPKKRSRAPLALSNISRIANRITETSRQHKSRSKKLERSEPGDYSFPEP